MSGAFRLSQAVRVLRCGGVIAYPTEAVWGLGCDPGNAVALHRLLSIKRRDPDKGLILVAAEQEQFADLLRGLSRAEREELAASWPGPVTWLIPHRGQIHPLVCGHHATVALRVSAHPVVRDLCLAFGGALVSTSANPQARPPAMDAATVRRYFGGDVDYLLPGKTGGGNRPSSIRDLETGRIIRSG